MLPHLKDVLTQKLEDTGVHGKALEGSSPETGYKSLFTECGHDAGIWECTPGKYRLERETDELFILLAGVWHLIGDAGDEYELKAGDTMLLRKGWKGIAHIKETIRKVYIAWES